MHVRGNNWASWKLVLIELYTFELRTYELDVCVCVCARARVQVHIDIRQQ
jgi:hypothetical protein